METKILLALLNTKGIGSKSVEKINTFVSSSKMGVTKGFVFEE